MYWIHALGALGVSMEATGPDPTIDTPQQIGMVVREPGAHQAVPGFPLTVGAEHGQGLDRALQRITSALLDAAESDRVVVAPGAHLMMEMLERSCWRQGLPMVRRAAREERSEEHTSELQSRGHLVCRLLLEKKNTNTDS